VFASPNLGSDTRSVVQAPRPIEECSDGELASVVSEGGARTRDAEAELCRRFARRLRLYGLRHLRDETAADDLVQDVLSLMLRKLRAGEVREPGRIASFVLGSARMLSHAASRSQRREREPLDERVLAATAPSPPDPFVKEQLHRALEELEERDRTVLLLTYYDAQDANEVASALGLTAGNVRVIRHRALARLRSRLSPEQEGTT
jgi:RNA polymerase sigma-70 factor (ECF subfamily)